MAKKSTSVKVTTGKVRLSWPKLFEPDRFDEKSDLKFSTMILIPKSDKETVERLRKAEKEAAELGKSKFPDGKIPAKLESKLRDGDGENKYGKPWVEDYPERAGHWFMSVDCKAEYPPKVVDGKLNPILDPSEIKSGDYARVSLSAYAYNNMNMGVSFGLRNVQKVADGEPLGGTSSAADDFDEIDEDDFI